MKPHYNPSIYVANLADYVNGQLNGKWFALSDFSCSEDLLGEISAFVGGDEWEIHDSEDLPQGAVKQWPLDTMIQFAELVSEFGETAYAYLSLDLDNDFDLIEDKFFGKFDNNAEFVDQYLEVYADMRNVPDIVQNNLDIDGIARDLEHGSEFQIVDLNGSLYVFYY